MNCDIQNELSNDVIMDNKMRTFNVKKYMNKDGIDYKHYETVAEMIDGLKKDHIKNNFVLTHFCCNNTGYGYKYMNTRELHNNKLYVYYTDIYEKELIVNFLENHGYVIENKDIEDPEFVCGQYKYRLFSYYKQ